jgi:hypothetical protein
MDKICVGLVGIAGGIGHNTYGDLLIGGLLALCWL